MEKEFRVSTSALGAGLDALEAALREAHLPNADVLDLRCAAEEVLTNVAKYGHEDDRGEHQVRMRLAIGPGEATLVFADNGRPFDPTAAPPLDLGESDRPIGGLGIHLTLALMDRAEYARVGDENVLTLRKRLGPAVA